MSPTAVLGNVIFPAPGTPYVMGFFMPGAVFLAMAAEVATFLAFQRRAQFLPLVGLVLAANLFSWIAGIALYDSAGLPDGLVTRGDGEDERLVPGPDYRSWVNAGFAIACAASILLEGAFLWAVRRGYDLLLDRLALCVVAANLASYATLFLWQLLYPGL